ncbi:MAG: fluoride efflux transporter CrcB [Arenimonas sp.]
MRLLALVMLGGALGAGMRHLVGAWMLRHFSSGWPLGTLAVNLGGAFLAGLAFAWLESRGPSAMPWRAFLIVGVLGGMTTFSALMLECLLFARTDRPAMVAAYLGASLVGGLVLVWAGALLGRAAHG